MSREIFTNKAPRQAEISAVYLIEKPNILMTLPDIYAVNETLYRWNGLKKAIELAGANVVVAKNPFGYMYSRDLFILLEGLAFYPQTPAIQKTDHRRKGFLPNLSEWGYQPYALNAYPDYSYDGGNFVYDDERSLLLTGMNNHFDEVEELSRSLRFSAYEMALAVRSKALIIDMTHLHLDCCLGLLPNGQLLVKLDETILENEIKQATGKDWVGSALTGVQNYALHTLGREYGRENIISYAFSNKVGADVCLGLKDFNNEKKLRSLSMLTNFESIGQTIIGEQFPEQLANILTSRGMTLIAPQDVGLETFLMGDDSFVGGARCCTLKVAKVSLDDFAYHPTARYKLEKSSLSFF